MTTYDAIVAGLGVMGAATLSHLARAGLHVLGIDRYAPPHAHGSSHGETRLLRIAYAEGEAYVPMMQRAVGLWRALEDRMGERLFHQTGVHYLGRENDAFLAGALASARLHGLSLQHTAAEPGFFDVPKDWLSFVEPEAGYLKAEESLGALLRDAVRHGAEIRTGETLVALERDGARLNLTTEHGIYTGERIALCLGAWSARHMPFLKPLLRLEQHVLYWHEAPEIFEEARGFRPFAIAPQDGVLLYGFPRLQGAVKLADHFRGSALDAPERLGAALPQSELHHMTSLASRYLPGLGACRHTQPCIYTMTSDERFLLDAHPGLPGVYFLAGLSGHGFKFAPVLGEALAHLMMGRPQEIDARYFALARFLSP